MKQLFLFTLGFPYPAESMETYLETEVKYYSRFQKVSILALEVKKKDIKEQRKIDCENAEIFPVSFAPYIVYVLYAIRALFDVNLYKEIVGLAREKKIRIRRLIHLMKYVSRSHLNCNKIRKTLKLSKKYPIRDAVLYSYRFDHQPYVMILLRRYFDNPVLISRAHGYDLYEDRSEDGYIPMRKILLEKINRVYLISNHGKKYLSKRYPQYASKMSVSRLGTLNEHGICDEKNNKSVNRLVSCSNIIPVKRVELIMEAISKIDNVNIEWVHFGGGEALDNLKIKADDIGKANIKCIFMGQTDNKAVLDYYNCTDIDLFINLSEAEGLPVSIMEAFSFGIPCIATNVGGTAEIVRHLYNGILIDPCADAYEISAIICKYFRCSEERKRALSTNAFLTWANEFDADMNYKAFVEDLLQENGHGKIQ